MSKITGIDVTGFHIAPVYGGQEVVTSADVTITSDPNLEETYEVKFVRNQITARIEKLNCLSLGKNENLSISTTIVEEMTTDYLENQ